MINLNLLHLGRGFIRLKLVLPVLMLCMVFFMVQGTMDHASAASTNQTTVSKTNQTVTSATALKTTSKSTETKLVSSTNKVYFKPAQIRSAATTVKNSILLNHKLPSYVTIGSTKVKMPQFLELLTTTIIKINYKDSTSILLKSVTNSTGTETIKTSNFNKTSYLMAAKTLKKYMDTYHKVPGVYKTSNGRMDYSNLIYTYCKIIDFYNVQNRLPNYVSVTTFKKVIALRPVYITSDNIINKTADNARINSIVKGLRALGLYAVNWGLGPNSHVAVLGQTNIPKNALVVDIYGGACAGTLYEMGLDWYKNLRASKKVYTIFWPPSTQITGLDFLPRAHDDNFTPKYGEVNGFPNQVDVNKDGVFETGLPGREDGLAHPDQYLHSNGYQYIYSGDISTIVNAIYKQTLT